MSAQVDPSAIVYPGTVFGDGVKVLENAVVGKQPTLSPRSTEICSSVIRSPRGRAAARMPTARS